MFGTGAACGTAADAKMIVICVATAPPSRLRPPQCSGERGSLFLVAALLHSLPQ